MCVYLSSSCMLCFGRNINCREKLPGFLFGFVVVVVCSLLWPLDRNYFLFHYLPIFSWEMEVGCIYLIWGTRSEDRSPVVVMGGQL